MADAWGGSWGASWGSSWTTVAPAPVESARGGDDAFHHRGWDKEAWAKKQVRDDALEATIVSTYRQVMGISPEPEVLQEVVRQVETAPEQFAFINYSGIAEWLQAQESIIQSIIARHQEQDDEDALILLTF